MRNVIRKGVDSFKVCSLLLFKAVVAFAIVNIVLFVAYQVKDRNGPVARQSLGGDVIEDLGMSALREVYPGYKDEDIRLLLKETWDRGLEYDPFLQFKERAHTGKWVNVAQNGFRLSKNNGPWPPDPKNLNVFLFGGSTTFGYGLADDQTVASHLQDFLGRQSGRDVKVYNFGSGYFFSTQERTQFLNLLAEGVMPHVAIFIDGVNDLLMDSGEPWCTDDVRKLWDDPARSVAGERVVTQLPLTRFIDSIKRRLGRNPPAKATLKSHSYDDTKKLAASLDRYAQNKRLIEAAAAAYGVRPVFVWQPMPAYRYQFRNDRSGRIRGWAPPGTEVGYSMMARIVKENPKDYDQNFLWLADIQEQCKEAIYVDSFHYTGKFSDVIAVAIGRFVLERKIIAGGTARSQSLASSEHTVNRFGPTR